MLRLLKVGHWEYVERPNASGIVGIVAIMPINGGSCSSKGNTVRRWGRA